MAEAKETEEKEESSWSWKDIISGVTDTGKSAAEIYKAFIGDSDETAYLQGQLAGIQSTQANQTASDTVKIGDFEISTSSILWIVGGTLGLLMIGIGVKKML